MTLRPEPGFAAFRRCQEESIVQDSLKASWVRCEIQSLCVFSIRIDRLSIPAIRKETSFVPPIRS
jgi:hypothetical protein